jgi:hypothetical protein
VVCLISTLEYSVSDSKYVVVCCSIEEGDSRGQRSRRSCDKPPSLWKNGRPGTRQERNVDCGMCNWCSEARLDV